LQALPFTGVLLIAGFFALTGSPPFGPFISLFTIVQAVFTGGWFLVGVMLLVLLLLVFIGMGTTILAAVQGRRPDGAKTVSCQDTLITGAPMMVLLGIVLLLGIYIPGPVRTLLYDAAQFLEARP
jgi:hydrogenase-4 component F